MIDCESVKDKRFCYVFSFLNEKDFLLFSPDIIAIEYVGVLAVQLFFDVLQTKWSIDSLKKQNKKRHELQSPLFSHCRLI